MTNTSTKTHTHRHTPHHSTPHPFTPNSKRRRTCRRSAPQEPVGGDKVPFHPEVGTHCRNHGAAWSRPDIPAMRSARVPSRMGKLRKTDIHRESSSSTRSTRRTRAKNEEDAVAQRHHRTDAHTLHTPDISTQSSRTPCTLQTTQKPPPTALLIVARPPTLQHAHDPAFGLHLTIPHLSPQFTQANVVTGHA